jgi:D-alanyl-lipoteichoic acid acyltransferase DltB (MBOAT superfamily)
MLFNSLIFLLFGFLFFSLLPWINKQKNNIRWLFLTIASFIFYGWWDWRFLFLILGSGLIDYFAGLLIINTKRYRTLYLIISLLGNLGSLAAFKYSRFLAENISSLLNNIGFQVDLTQNIPEFMYILPVGISFYTFQSMSYTIDIYRGRLQPTKNILHFFSYLALFPQLVAGPIVRARDLLPQLTRVRAVSQQENWNGFYLILVGFFKKVVLADNIAPLVNFAFNDVGTNQSMLYWWVVMIGFSFQIYFDFSGYSDIARGLAKWMGLHFRVNFNHPYISRSLKEFWTRWHISLSTWFRDYVYIPLGGSKKGKLRSHINMWITMVVSGFWHGAAWNFIIWGALHAFYTSLERITKHQKHLSKIKFGNEVSWILVMIQVIIAWVFFRAQTFGDAISVVAYLFSFNGDLELIKPGVFNTALFYIIVGLLIEMYFYLRLNKKWVIKRNNKIRIQYVQFVIMIIMIILLRGKGQEFIYFQF